MILLIEVPRRDLEINMGCSTYEEIIYKVISELSKHLSLKIIKIY
jgi:hypothetical protein